jgi:hypothetical protein
MKREIPDRSGLTGFIYGRISSVYGERESSLRTQKDRCSYIAQEKSVTIPDEFVLLERDSGHETIDTRKRLLEARLLAREGKVGWRVHRRLGPPVAHAGGAGPGVEGVPRLRRQDHLRADAAP